LTRHELPCAPWDALVEDGDIFGDGVNIAARLEGLAEPGGICVSARVQEDAAGKLDLAFDDIGEQQLKNIARPVRVFRVRRPLTHPAAIALGSPNPAVRERGPSANGVRRVRVAGWQSQPCRFTPASRTRS